MAVAASIATQIQVAYNLVAENSFRVHRWLQCNLNELLSFAGAMIIESLSKLRAEGVNHVGGFTGDKQQMNRK